MYTIREKEGVEGEREVKGEEGRGGREEWREDRDRIYISISISIYLSIYRENGPGVLMTYIPACAS